MMEEVLFVCPLSPIGHVNVNHFFIRAFSRKYNITFIARRSHVVNSENTKVKIIEIPNELFDESNSLKSRITCFKVLIWLIKYFKEYDKIFFLSYEILSLKMFTILKHNVLKNKKMYLLTSNQIDEIDNSWIKKNVWKSLSNEFIHVVKENHMEEYILDNYPNKKTICIKRNKNALNDNRISTEIKDSIMSKYSIDRNKKIIISPSKTSSDYEHINEILENVELEDYEIVVLVKDKRSILIKPGVTIIDGFLEEVILKNLIYMSDIIWLPYKLSFKYRSSTMLLEMVEYEKPILGRKIPTFSHYFNSFSIGELYENVLDFQDKLRMTNTNNYQFAKIKEEFNDEFVVKNMLSKIEF